MEHECLREKRRGEGNVSKVSITLREELRIGGGEKEISVMRGRMGNQEDTVYLSINVEHIFGRYF